MMSNKFIQLWFVFILFLAPTLGSTSEKSSTKSDSLKTFTNKRFGWSIQYPETWIVRVPEEDSLPPADNPTVVVTGPKDEGHERRQFGIMGIDVYTTTRGALAGLDSKPYQEADARSRHAHLINGAKRTIDGNPAYEVGFVYDDDRKGVVIKQIGVKHGQKMFIIQYNELIGEPGATISRKNWKYERIFDDILKTFHFTN